MNTERTVFSQLVEFLPHQQFQKCVDRYGGGRYLKNLSCWDQYLAMAFAPLTYRESFATLKPASVRSAASSTTWDWFLPLTLASRTRSSDKEPMEVNISNISE